MTKSKQGKSMNIYLLKQNENVGYDTFDSIVVIAKNSIEAKLIHPYLDISDKDYDTWENSDAWATKPTNVTATLIGKMEKTYTQNNPIICTSFNAG